MKDSRYISMMDELMELCSRWVGLLRHKASVYEHEARKKGEVVTTPSLDGLAWEIKAFFEGLKSSN